MAERTNHNFKVGILALQGDVEEHYNALQKVKNKPDFKISIVKAKTKKDIEESDALIIPGGESTTLSRLIEYYDLYDLIKNKRFILGTCAGLILMSKDILGKREWQKSLELLDITVSRNAYGSQVHSFSQKGIITLGKNSYEIVQTFIRAPKIVTVNSDKVRVISKLDDEITGVELKTDKVHYIGLTFHPELETELVHEYFVKSIHNYI
ncbi:MAG: pyridoxal 5'-phosphate synthase glutaminase subunit PdxT [Candidatus Micrarchaeota archaeon]|nr:pyridoxal 5'-phosphate synthase glutaminase subunit PdxT [Candidatus Micrarchaeota archaeon]